MTIIPNLQNLMLMPALTTTMVVIFDVVFVFGVFQLGKVSANTEVERHLEVGKQLLAKGLYNDALQHYHSAIDLDPGNYQSYFRRATVFLALGKINSALPDLDRVVELKPDFVSGRIQRGNILLKQGRLDDAQNDYIFARNHDSAESHEHLEQINEIRSFVDQASYFYDNGEFASAEHFLDKAIEHCVWDPDLHRKRSKCRMARGETQNAIADIRVIAKLIPDSTETYLEISRMYYEVGDIENALTQIRECLKLNPDHKQCFPFYKRIKKLAKLRDELQKTVNAQKWMDCLAKGQEIMKFESEVDNVQLEVFRHTCRCNNKLGHVVEAIQECTEYLNHVNENDLDVLLERGEALLQNEQYDEAIEDFQKALNVNGESKRAKEALHRAQKLQKQAKKKDYYKILGVRRNADKRTIMKAYRKLAQKWHPDQFQSDAEKARAQEKFFDIANAKEVLTNPEKRQRFDAGDDPLDPEQQAQGGGHWQQHFQQHFQGHGFNPFGNGEGFTFKFNFG